MVAGPAGFMVPVMPMSGMSGMPMDRFTPYGFNRNMGRYTNGNMIKSPIWNNKNFDQTKFNQFLQKCFNMPGQNSNQSNNTNQNQSNDTKNASDTDFASVSKNSKTPIVLESSLVKACLAHRKYMAGIKKLTHDNTKFPDYMTRIKAEGKRFSSRGCAKNSAVYNSGVKEVM
ncbi:hypothetical protein BB561_003057 [Smittium simulii]|uniref:Uncharacterized protein n=1 Tax=Smittium simulii TaxID=133385 RepID=A0A2T9YN64_9FUNG|nr:hypothetical protein BB561_003057 [Smittium simulii]